MALITDIERSGLTLKDQTLMRLKELSANQVQKETKFYHTPAYRIPYFDARGKPTDFYRLRFTEPVHDRNNEEKLLRYWQPPKSAPHIYLSPHIPWEHVLKDSNMPIILTEGEKKAAAGCKLMKRPVIGLGGVWSWGSKRDGEIILPDLIPFLKDRDLFICFDHEPTPKPNVISALHHLARSARTHGASVRCLSLPELRPGEKAGLDDVLVELGAEAVAAIEPTSFEDIAELASLNDELAYIRSKAAIYHLPTHSLFEQPARLVNTVYATRRVIKYNAKGEPVEKNLAAEWMKWPRRRTHKDLTYEPGKPDVLEDGSLNVWPGLGITPKKGDISPYMKLLDQVFADDADGSGRKFIQQWLAYPLVHLGTKLYTGVLMFSIKQGVGKSLLAETMRTIYGDNFVGIKADEVQSDFSDWARHRQFVLGDEVTGRERREDENRLKNLVTQEFCTINIKYQVPYRLRDKANYWLTTNHPDALHLDDDDRRWFVWEIQRQTINDEHWYTKFYHNWYRDPKNAAALLYYFQNKVDLSDFDPRGKAPQTKAKTDMQVLSNVGSDFQVRDLLAAPDRFLLGSVKDLYMAGELSALLGEHGQKAHPVAIARALRRAGVVQLPETKTKRGVIKLYAIRNQDKWLKASHQQRANHYDGESK